MSKEKELQWFELTIEPTTEPEKNTYSWHRKEIYYLDMISYSDTGDPGFLDLLYFKDSVNKKKVLTNIFQFEIPPVAKPFSIDIQFKNQHGTERRKLQLMWIE